MLVPKKIAAFMILFVLGSCGGHEKYMRYQEERNARLRAAYPAGIPRMVVHAKLTTESGVEMVPVLSGVRPETGWATVPQVPGGNWCLRAEERTKQTITSFERYSRADGMFSLCYYWFYYNRGDSLVDAEWQYQSD